MNRRLSQALVSLAVVGALGLVGGGCLTRPVVSNSPLTQTNFTTVIQNQTVDKLDLLFMIDNSASMGDKQALLALAVPDMIQRLVQPLCVDANGTPTGGNANPDGSGCASGKPEFPPVHDMHLAVVTSSLGDWGGNECATSGTGGNPHNNDRGELINRGGSPTDPTVTNTVADATSPDNFLSWYPSVPANMGSNSTTPPTTAIGTVGAAGQTGTLVGDFTQLIAGVHQDGCGFENQNEAWYRFLVQPDPYESVTINKGAAQLTGIDDTILKQRAAFLRPDSLVAIIVVTDENGSDLDPLSLGGEGWNYGNNVFPGSPVSTGDGTTAAEGTIECSQPVDPNNPTTTGPYSPNCTSCGFKAVQTDPAFATRCPNDGAAGMKGYLDPSDDYLNVRFFEPKRRYGVDFMYPVTKYVRGMTKETVADAQHEHDNNGSYVGDQDTAANCVNPLYAQDLPTSSQGQELCALTRGPRTPDLVYYAAISGVPHQLLQAKPGDPECAAGTAAADCPQKNTLTDADWTLITGADSQHYDFTGIDYHMVESWDPRTQNSGGWANASSCPPGSPVSCDPVNGGEWSTSKKDLEFACIFDLRPQYGGAGKDCTNPIYAGGCDCTANGINANSQLCNGTTQIYGKAYPCLREMEIAHAMANVNAQSGGQGIVSSLCPIHVSEQGANDPLYGYRPAVNAIVNRLKTALSAQCVPQKLVADKTCGSYPCLVLVSLDKNAKPGDTSLCKNPGAACDAAQGLSAPTGGDVDVVAKFCDSQEATWKKSMAGPEPYTVPVCEMKQLFQGPPGAPSSCSPAPAAAADFDATGSCANSPEPGWCYVTGAAAGACGHSIVFTASEPPSGSNVSLQCIEQSVAAIDAGGGG